MQIHVANEQCVYVCVGVATCIPVGRTSLIALMVS